MDRGRFKAKTRIRIPKKSRIAFVCSGGAVKAGAFHLGVALALQEKGFQFLGGLKREESDHLKMRNSSGKEINIYVGSSAGSIICAYLAAGYNLDQIFDSFLGRKNNAIEGMRLKRINYATMFSLRKDLKLLNGLSFLNFKKWLKWPGLFSTDGIEKYLREEVLPSNDFKSYGADLFIVATQLNHSKKVVFGKYRFSPPEEDKTVAYRDSTGVSQACAASIALPLIFTPYPIKNEKGHTVYYFDGEIRDTLSTHVGFDAGADLIFASYTHQPYHYSREIGSLHDYGIPAILVQALYLNIERKIQSASNTVARNRRTLDAVSKFFKDNDLPEAMRKKCLMIIEKKLGFKSGVEYIYIHPKADDHQMFFGDHFNLSGKKMTEIVRSGFRSAIDVLRRYEFE